MNNGAPPKSTPLIPVPAKDRQTTTLAMITIQKQVLVRTDPYEVVSVR